MICVVLLSTFPMLCDCIMLIWLFILCCSPLYPNVHPQEVQTIWIIWTIHRFESMSRNWEVQNITTSGELWFRAQGLVWWGIRHCDVMMVSRPPQHTLDRTSHTIYIRCECSDQGIHLYIIHIYNHAESLVCMFEPFESYSSVDYGDTCIPMISGAGQGGVEHQAQSESPCSITTPLTFSNTA